MWLPREKLDGKKRCDWQRQWSKRNMTLSKRYNWSSCRKLALSASWTHGLTGQSRRASKKNSVIVGLNTTRSNFLYLLHRILQWWTVYVLAHSATLMWLPQENFNRNKRGDWWRQWPKRNMTLNKRSHWRSSTKLALIATWTHGLIAQSITASEWNSLIVGKESHSGLLSVATWKNTSVSNTICISSFRWSHLITSRKSYEKERGDWRRQWSKWKMTLNKRYNWKSSTKLAVCTSWTHGLPWSWVQILLMQTFCTCFKESFSCEYHLYQLIWLHSCDYLEKTSMKKNVATHENNSRNGIWHWTKDAIGVAVQSWLWVGVELTAWWLSGLERLNGIQRSLVQIPLGQLF